MMLRAHHRSQAGFSLIEMGICLLILSVLMIGGLYLYKTYKRDRAIVNEQVARERIVSALAEFVQKYDRFPCPAPLNLTPNDADFGKEPAGCTIGAAGPTDITTGMVPVYALNLPFQRAMDIYSRKMTYVVTSALMKTNGANSPSAAIRVRSNNGETRTAQFIIVNHGPDGKGATALLSTTPGLPCTGTSPDAENCDGDRDFNDFLYAAQSNPYDANHFDDHLTYNLATKETSLWVMAPTPDGMRISNKNNANVGIGKTMPAEKLHVNGSVKVDSASTDVKVSATGKIITHTSATPGSGDIYSDSRLQAGTTMEGEKIRATIFTYEAPPP